MCFKCQPSAWQGVGALYVLVLLVPRLLKDMGAGGGHQSLPAGWPSGELGQGPNPLFLPATGVLIPPSGGCGWYQFPDLGGKSLVINLQVNLESTACSSSPLCCFQGLWRETWNVQGEREGSRGRCALVSPSGKDGGCCPSRLRENPCLPSPRGQRVCEKKHRPRKKQRWLGPEVSELHVHTGQVGRVGTHLRRKDAESGAA